MNCRLCGTVLGPGPRFEIARAPSAAQAFAATADEARGNATKLTIAQCMACGLVQSVSPVVPSYRRAVTAAGVSPPMRHHRAAQARTLAQVKPGRTALVGCGTGYELEILAAAGLAPEGIEWGGGPPGGAGAWPVHDGYPDGDASLPGAPYAAFACFNFLEHAPDPAGFLHGIARSLEPDAIGVIEVPNYEQMVRDRRAFDYVADHVSYFDAATLRHAVEHGGFCVDEVEEVRGGENVVAWVRRAAIDPAVRSGDGSASSTDTPATAARAVRPAPLQEHSVAFASARASVVAHLTAAKARGALAAVWGASHQALTLLATADASLVAAIIDSAPTKQGRFAPASGIPVIAPSREALAGPESVIIIATGYVDEIRARLGELGFAGRTHAIRDARVVALD